MGSRLEKGAEATRKRIEAHTFDHEEGDEYGGSSFGGFPEYFRRKKIKLQNLDAELRANSTDKPPIFRGIVAQVNGYTQPSLNDLHKLIVQYGGGFMQYLDGKTTVTHIIASSLTPKKAIEFRRYRIVKPAWIVESIKAGKLLPWDSFRVLDEGAGQRVIGFNEGKVVNKVSTQTRGYKDQTDTSWYTSQVRAERGASQRTPFLSQVAGNLVEDDIDDIEDLPPPSTQLPTQVSKAREVHEDVHVTIASHEQLPTSTPLLIRDLRQMHDVNSTGEDAQADAKKPTDATEVDVESVDKGAVQIGQEDIPRGEKRHSEELRDSLQEESPQKKQKLTAEDHNKILLADPRIWKSSVINPNFLEQYYRESRLHHLSAWKADLKSQLQAMAEEKTATQKARQKRPAGARRYILHVDFDSFFAAVSLKKAPQFKDKPTVVAHGAGDGSEIASCNYPARKFGISNGMWMKRAHELCPDLHVLPYDFPAYEEASRAFYEAIIATNGIIQSVSIDEALIDISMLCFAAVGGDGIKRHEGTVYREQKAADEIAQKLRDEVKQRTGCDVSVGIGGNILLAKVALRNAKPAGQHQIRPEEVLDFIGQLEVKSLPGVAYSIGGRLEEMGVVYVKDIRDLTKEKMMTTLGPKTGEKLWDYSRGIDRKEVGDVEIRKSVSAEVNWGVRFYEQFQVDEFIGNLCGELSTRLIKERVKGKQLSLKIMRRSADAPLDPPKHLGHGKCDTFNKSVILGVATNSQDVLAKEALSMLKSLGFRPGELRGIGVQMTRLEPLKPTTGPQDGSQRRLLFKVAEPVEPNEAESEPKDDPIEDVVTPKKPTVPPDKALFGADELNISTPSRKPLNTMGTQFILPTQIDPAVLAELPADIRTKLEQHMKTSGKSMAPPKDQPRPPQATPKVFTALPAESQIDLEILESLPASVRSEIKTFYNKSPTKPRIGEQAVLPQSPRKNRTIPPSKRPMGPVVRRRGRPGKFEVRSNANNATLTQSNFIAARMGRHGSQEPTTTDTEGDDAEKHASGAEGMDADFLAALPEDIRRELMDEQRRKRLAKTSSLQFNTRLRKKGPPPRQPNQGPIERMLKLPARAPKPTFTTRKLSTVPELRDALSEWGREFRKEGPYSEDTDALALYLHRVIVDEGNMGKALTAVKWLIWLVDEEFIEEDDAREKWAVALATIKLGVQKSVEGRGLGKVKF